MSSPGTSRRMRELWADPTYRANMLAKFAERSAKPGRKPSGPRAKTGTKRGTLAVITVGLDPEQQQAVTKIAENQGKSVAEIIRTYVEWGLETERAA